MENDTNIPRGHLKIFFGYAAGVGKTYTMLKAAHIAKRRGIDVVVGYVEPHQRPQTTQLLNGLEILPNKEICYKGIQLQEFGIDAAISRKPKLILIDELAHSNANGSRHPKRFQDVEELLRNGIDVYTTVNVQHIESLNDMVESITGISVSERIPDYVFDGAYQVELVDIEPFELIERLKEGKIYKDSQAKKALSNFFDIKNLTALREIALRRCADRVNLMSEKIRLQKKESYYTDEHILVCLSASPTNAKIIRTAARMCSAFRGTLTALLVETPSFSVMSEQNKARLSKNVHLAEQLGATIETVQGEDIPFQIAEFARISGVSKIVLGRSNTTRRFFWSKLTLTERLAELAPNIDIHIIPDKNSVAYKETLHPKNKLVSFETSLPDFIKTVAFLGAATGIGFIFYHFNFSEANIIVVYILSVLLTSVFTASHLCSLFSSFAGVLLFNYFFTAPRFSFDATDFGYPVTFIIMFIVAFITSSLATKLKQHAKQSAQNAYKSRILFETNQLLQKADASEDIINITCKQILKLLNKSIIFYPIKQGQLAKPICFLNDEANKEQYLTSNELAVAKWVFKNNKQAGAGTSTLSNAKARYLAIRVNHTVYGIIGIVLEDTVLQSTEENILLSILNEVALALENQKNRKEKEAANIMVKNEQLRSTLLRSISHDLRTPLTSISGNADILIDNEAALSPQKKKEIYYDIYDDSLWLINLVENILSVTKIEDGSMKLNCTAELMEDVILEALKHIDRKKNEHKIIFKENDEYLLAKIDARLIVQVIINLVNNAIKYTPVNSQIIISYKKSKDFVMVSVADDGDGLSLEAKKRIFDMFYTADTKIADSRRSMGLGLALCKSIILAHGGEILVNDNNPKGTIFSFTVPSKEVKSIE